MAASNRIWVLAGSLVIVVVLALAGLLGVKPQLDAAQASDAQRKGVEALNAQHRAELVALKDEFTRLPEISAEVTELRKAVAANTDLDAVIAEFAAMQVAHGVTITSYNGLDPVPFLPTSAVVGQVPPTVNATNFLTTEIQLTIEGTREATLAFVKALQSGSRLFFVTDLAIAPEGGSTVTMLVYTLLDTPLVDPAAVVETPAPEAAASE